jgi:hypothetical protein
MVDSPFVAPVPAAEPAALAPDNPPAKGRRSSRPTTRAARRAAGEKAGAAAKADRTPRRTVPRAIPLKVRLIPVLQMPALLMQARCQVCALHMLTAAESTAEAWCELAKSDERVRRALEALTTGSTLTTALIATAGYVVPVLAHHGILPAAMAGPLAGLAQIQQMPDEHAGHGGDPVEAAA